MKKMQESIGQLTAQLSALVTCLNNDPKQLAGVLHSTARTSEGKCGPEALNTSLDPSESETTTRREANELVDDGHEEGETIDDTKVIYTSAAAIDR